MLFIIIIIVFELETFVNGPRRSVITISYPAVDQRNNG